MIRHKFENRRKICSRPYSICEQYGSKGVQNVKKMMKLHCQGTHWAVFILLFSFFFLKRKPVIWAQQQQNYSGMLKPLLPQNTSSLDFND